MFSLLANSSPGTEDRPAHCFLSQSDGLGLWEDLGCPAHKLVLGVPFYGHSYVLSANSTSYEPGTPIDKEAKAAGGMPYYQV
jgi:chitinase